jgi:hypothetical protein
MLDSMLAVLPLHSELTRLRGHTYHGAPAAEVSKYTNSLRTIAWCIYSVIMVRFTEHAHRQCRFELLLASNCAVNYHHTQKHNAELIICVHGTL